MYFNGEVIGEMFTILNKSNQSVNILSFYNKVYGILNKYRTLVLMLIDASIALFSCHIPLLIFGLQDLEASTFILKLVLYNVIYILTFKANGMYKNLWRYSGYKDLLQCLKASAIASVLFLLVAWITKIPVDYGEFLLVSIISCFGTITVRLVYREMRTIVERKIDNDIPRTNVMLIGAGQATALLLEELESNNPNNYLVKCIIDDDDVKIGRSMYKINIVGNTANILEMSEKHEIDIIIVVIPSIDKENKRRILDICSKTQCKLKILPEFCSLIPYDSINSFSESIRDVQIEDLLGREPIALDCESTKGYLNNKTVLVTGGGGSIGSELCRQIASCYPKKLIILDEYENNAYEIQRDLLCKYGDKLNLEIEIASVRDGRKLEKVFLSNEISIIFHAAAHKHVPLMEHNPEEAVKNNIIGTYNTVRMADKFIADKFILISTDKAVNPTSIMGATKRICEMIVQSYAKHSSTNFSAVRFGNVLGSNGSVIPLFKQQIKEGGPVTITHENITRYFMTIPEAVQLVLKAASIAEGGEIFVLDMGEPVKIKDLAYNLIRLSGLIPEDDIKVEYIGLRPGEKLYEELLIAGDASQTKTEIEKIFIEKPMEFDEKQFFESLEKMVMAAKNNERDSIVSLIEKTVPTYKKIPEGQEKGFNVQQTVI